MSRATTPSNRALRILAAVVVTAGAVALAAISLTPARAAGTGRLRQRISAGQGRVSSLAGQVGAASRRVGALGQSIAGLNGQVTRLQHDLDAKRVELLRLRSRLAAARTRLQALQAAEQRAESVLSTQLVGSYEADRPDLVTVVLESTGFNDLLERLAFAQRINRQDTQVTTQVRSARRAVAAEATRLGALSLRQQRLTTQVLGERNQVDRTRMAIVSEQISAIRARDRKAGQLSTARGQLVSLHDQLNHLIAAQTAAAARARRVAAQSAPSGTSGASGSNGASGASGSNGASGSSGSPSSSAPVTPVSSGGFTFPMPKGSASPPGTWSLDDGVDISAPGGTPLLAVCSGTVVLHGIGGFGPSAPVIHCDGPLAGYDYVYYGHAGPGNWTPVGTHVSQGQVVSEVGSGIVGISTGPHLEMGFANSAGAPVGPSSAPAMSALLHAAYGG